MSGGNAVGSTQHALRYLIVNINQHNQHEWADKSYDNVAEAKKAFTSIDHPEDSHSSALYLVQKSKAEGLHTLLNFNQEVIKAKRIEVFRSDKQISTLDNVKVQLLLKRARFVWNVGNTPEYQFYFSLDDSYQNNLKDYAERHPDVIHYVCISDNENEENKRFFLYEFQNGQLHKSEIQPLIENILEDVSIKTNQLKKSPSSLKLLAEKLKTNNELLILQKLDKTLDAILDLEAHPKAQDKQTIAINTLCELQRFSEFTRNEVWGNVAKTVLVDLVSIVVLAIVLGGIGSLTMGAGVLPTAVALGALVGMLGGATSGFFFFRHNEQQQMLGKSCNEIRDYVNSLVPAPG